MTIEQLYKNYFSYKNTSGHVSKEAEDAFLLLKQAHWYSLLAEFDPLTAEAMPLPLSKVLRKTCGQEKINRDRLWRITDHARQPMLSLFRELNESPRREHAVLPLHAVRELDTASFMALSRRPGRNIREKLAGRPYMQALRHFQSVDLPENRLLKDFAERLAELLELRHKYLKEDKDELLEEIRNWLETDEAQSIGHWDNLPPNNTLLTHRNYRAVYDSWQWLQSLDDDLTEDLKHLEERQETMRRWTEYRGQFAPGSDLSVKTKYLFPEMPVLFDYEKFEIRPWTDLPVRNDSPHFHQPESDRITTPVCIDLTELFPTYAFLSGDTASPKTQDSCPLLWQQWKNADSAETIDIELFHAEAAYLHPDATTISAPDLFFATDTANDQLDRAARAFASKLRETFTDNKLFWLMPDDPRSDFALKIIRRNINAHFPGAEPLPRSIAAVFEQVDYRRLHDGYSVVVVDTVGGVQCATKLEAHHNPKLEKRAPETRGFYWERQPSVIFSRENEDEQDANQARPTAYDIATVDADGYWHKAKKPKKAPPISEKTLRGDKRIGKFHDIITLSDSPVRGGIRLFTMQKKAGDIPLWCEQIPALFIKGKSHGRYQFSCLVAHGSTSVKPVRDNPVRIHIPESFKLPKGKDSYPLPLVIGENEEELGISARLESPAFPLQKDLYCNLKLTFTYGADDPYCLIFEPINSSIPPIRAKWEKTEDEVITDAPAPEYPRLLTWNELRNAPREEGKTTDYLDWAEKSMKKLETMASHIDEERYVGTICRDWESDDYNEGAYYTFAECDNLDRNVKLQSGDFLRGFNYKMFRKGSRISFELKNGKFGKRIAGPDLQKVKDVVQQIHHGIYVPVIQVWRNGHSIYDKQCPATFRASIKSSIESLRGFLSDDDFPKEIRNEIIFLFACMHKDAPEECAQWVAQQFNGETIYNKQAVGFCLGDLSMPWQEAVFRTLVSFPSHDALRVFAYAIWRDPHFVEKFSSADLQSILSVLSEMLTNVKPCPPDKNEKDRYTKRNWNRKTVEPLELLLGLLRTRDSSDEEIRMLLQPTREITKELAKQVDRITGLFEQSHVTLFSRVQLGNLQKPEDDRTPDLLYALRLYLTGDDGASAIEIIGISDTDAD